MALAALAALTAPAAHATDNVPCHRPTKKNLTDPGTGRVWRGTEVMYCNLARSHAPV